MKTPKLLIKFVGVPALAGLTTLRSRLQARLQPYARHFAIACLAIIIPPALHADDFQSGLDAYHESQYAEAAAAFERKLEGSESASARHNLALSLYQQAQPAEAVWQLERAVRLDPLNESYLFKLGALRQQLGLYELPTTWWQSAANVLAQSIWIWIASIGFWIVVAAIMLPRIGGFNRPIVLKLLLGFATFALLLSTAALIIHSTQQASGVVVSNEGVMLHHAPASAAPEAGLARPGERAHILDQHKDFLKIETEAKITGWIEQSQFREL